MIFPTLSCEAWSARRVIQSPAIWYIFTLARYWIDRIRWIDQNLHEGLHLKKNLFAIDFVSFKYQWNSL